MKDHNRIPPMRDGETVRIVDTRTNSEYTQPPDYLQVPYTLEKVRIVDIREG